MAFPVADIVAIGFYLIGLHLFLRKSDFLGSLFWAAAIITHKALWFFVFFSFWTWFLSATHGNKARWLLNALVICAPLLLIWLLGAGYHNDIFWIIRSNLGAEVASAGSLPILNGLVGTLLNSGVKGLFKGGFVVFIFLLSVFLGWHLMRAKSLYWQFGLAICFSVFVLSIFLNQHEIWAVVRFSRLLVLPLFWAFSERVGASIEQNLAQSPGKKILIVSIISSMALLYGSQLAYAYYMARFFYA